VFSCSRGMHAYYVKEMGGLTPLSCSSQHIQVMPSASHDAVHAPARASMYMHADSPIQSTHIRRPHGDVVRLGAIVRSEGRVSWRREAPSFASKQSRRNGSRGGNDRLNSTPRSAGCVDKQDLLRMQRTTYVARRSWDRHDDSSRVWAGVLKRQARVWMDVSLWGAHAV